MVPIQATEDLIRKLQCGLNGLAHGFAEFDVAQDHEPLPTAWTDGQKQLILGVSGPVALPGLLVIVRTRLGQSHWEFLKRFERPIELCLQRNLPSGMVWRLAFEVGGQYLVCGRIGRARIGEALLQPTEGGMDVDSFLEDLLKLIDSSVRTVYAIHPSPEQAARFRASMVEGLANLPLGVGEVITAGLLRGIVSKQQAMQDQLHKLSASPHRGSIRHT